MNNNSRNSKVLNKTKRSRKGANNYDGSLSINNSLQRIPRQVGLILPDRYRTNLRFWKSVSFNFLASNVAGVRFRPSSAFDVDPLVASTAMAGFSELASLYSSYRVLSSTILVEAANTSLANPVALTVLPVNFDPGTVPSSAYVLAAREQPYSKPKMVGFAGSPVTRVVNSMSTEKIYGSKSVLFDDNFSAPSNATPANNWFWSVVGYIGILDPSLTWLEITIMVDVEFFDRNFLPN